MPKINLLELTQKAEAATHLPVSSDGIVYRPITRHGGIPIIPIPRIDVPMTKVDLSFYNESPETILALVGALKDVKRALDLIESQAKCCIISTEEECDMSANWVERRATKALTALDARFEFGEDGE